MSESSQRAVIWDMDGTLVDTGELHFEAWVKLCGEMGREFTRDDFAATFGKRNPEIFDYLLGDEVGKHDTEALADRKEALYREEAKHGVELLPGVRPLLEGLHRAGYAQAIGSSGPRANIELILELTRTKHLFGAISCAENTERGKPDPQVFQMAALYLGVPPGRCIVAEDAVAGVEAAKAGGMKCVAVTFVGHHPESKLRAAGADLVVPTLESLRVEELDKLLS